MKQLDNTTVRLIFIVIVIAMIAEIITDKTGTYIFDDKNNEY